MWLLPLLLRACTCAGLETLDIGGTNFSGSRALPTALVGAHALRRFELATNPKVVLRAGPRAGDVLCAGHPLRSPCNLRPPYQVRHADVDWLASLPRLQFLSVGVRMAPTVSLALEAAAPGLEVVQP